MGSVYRLNRAVKGIILAGLIVMLTGCTGELWNRISDLEQQMAMMTADHRVLPQQIETLQLKLQTMDQEVRSRQSRVLTEIEHFRDEDLAHFTERLDALAHNFQSLRKEMANSAPWEQVHAEVADVQTALTRMKMSLDQVQLQHDQSHSPAAKRSSSVPKSTPAPDTKPVSAAKAP